MGLDKSGKEHQILRLEYSIGPDRQIRADCRNGVPFHQQIAPENGPLVCQRKDKGPTDK